MKFDVKQIAGANFLTGLVVAGFIWILFGWALTTFHFAPVFKSINYYGLTTWFTSDLPFMAPLILFWYIVLFILCVLWLICLVTRAVALAKTLSTRPAYKGLLCAVHILAALVIVFHIADICTTTRINNIPIAKNGAAAFKSGLEITLGDINYTSGSQYINLPISAESGKILRSDLDITANAAVIGIKPPNAGVVYNETVMAKPFQYAGISVIIEKFYSNEGSLEAAGVWVTMSKKPLMPFIIVLYLLLAVSILGLMAAPRFEKATEAKAEAAPRLPAKTPGTSGIAKKKKKTKKY